MADTIGEMVRERQMPPDVRASLVHYDEQADTALADRVELMPREHFSHLGHILAMQNPLALATLSDSDLRLVMLLALRSLMKAFEMAEQRALMERDE